MSSNEEWITRPFDNLLTFCTRFSWILVHFFPLKERCWEQNCFNEINGNSVNKICLKFLSVFGLSSVMHYEIWRGEVYEGLKRQKIKLLGNSCANYPPKHILVYIRPSEIVRLLCRISWSMITSCFDFRGRLSKTT